MLLGEWDAGGYEPTPVRGATERFIATYNAYKAGNDQPLNALAVTSVVSFSNPGQSQPLDSFDTRIDIGHNPARMRVTRARITPNGPYLAVSDPSPDEVRVTIPPHDATIAVLLADADMPGWTAVYDGVHIPIQRTRDGLRRIVLPPESVFAEATFSYRPSSWRIGLYLSLIGCMFAVGYAAFAVLSRRCCAPNGQGTEPSRLM